MMNAANEELVGLFLERKIGFTDIQDSLKKILKEHKGESNPDLSTILRIDRETREKVQTMYKNAKPMDSDEGVNRQKNQGKGIFGKTARERL